jgi:hypothetical protein
MRRTLALVIAAMAAVLLASGDAPPARGQSPAASVAKKHHPVHRHYTRRAGGQIACTKFGCHRIPPNCHPATEYDFWGNPTGYDAVVCH